MEIYAIKFRNKSEKNYITALFVATDRKEFDTKLQTFLKGDDSFDIDKRTISWSGNSIPVGRTDKPLMIYDDLDKLT